MMGQGLEVYQPIKGRRCEYRQTPVGKHSLAGGASRE